MKKFVMMLMIALVAVGTVSAEKVNAFSYTKSQRSTMWYARVGLSVNNAAGGGKIANVINDNSEDGEFSYGPKAGLAVDFGFQKGIGKSGLYWGMELGIGTRGGYEKYEDGYGYWSKGNMDIWDVKYSPFTIGYKYALTDNLKLDGHLGIFLSYDFAGTDIKFKDSKGNTEQEPLDDYFFDYAPFDAGMQLGVGIWYGRFNLDFSYQRGFVPMGSFDAGDDEYKLHASNFVIRLGVAF